MSDLKKQFHFYLSNQNEFLKKFNGRYLIIQNEQVAGDYATLEEAAKDAIEKKIQPGEFLIQHCTPGSEGYTQTFHSRVSFV